jgi:hypothetical protein
MALRLEIQACRLPLFVVFQVVLGRCIGISLGVRLPSRVSVQIRGLDRVRLQIHKGRNAGGDPGVEVARIRRRQKVRRRIGLKTRYFVASFGNFSLSVADATRR